MRVEAFSFGSIRIDGVTYTHDVVIDRGHVRKRKKKPSWLTGPCADVARAAGSTGTANSTARRTAREPLPEAA